MGYKCRGHVTSISFDGTDLNFTFKSITQFDYKKNNIGKDSEKYNILCDETKKSAPDHSLGIKEDQTIKGGKIFSDLLKFAYEQESTFEIDVSGGKFELKSLKVGHENA